MTLDAGHAAQRTSSAPRSPTRSPCVGVATSAPAGRPSAARSPSSPWSPVSPASDGGLRRQPARRPRSRPARRRSAEPTLDPGRRPVPSRRGAHRVRRVRPGGAVHRRRPGAGHRSRSSAPRGPAVGGPRRSRPPATTRTAARRQIREYVLRFDDTGSAEQASLKRAYADLAASCPATVDPSEGTLTTRYSSAVPGLDLARAQLAVLRARGRVGAELLRGRDRPPGQRRRRPGVAGVGQPGR